MAAGLRKSCAQIEKRLRNGGPSSTADWKGVQTCQVSVRDRVAAEHQLRMIEHVQRGPQPRTRSETVRMSSTEIVGRQTDAIGMIGFRLSAS
jgi:hypothetical protein